MAQLTSIPAPPPGFVLDDPAGLAGGIPPPPPGFVLDAPGMAPMPPTVTEAPADEGPGFFGHLSRSAQRGFRQLQQLRNLYGLQLGEDPESNIERIAELERTKQSLEPSAALLKFNQAKDFDEAIEAFLEAPIDVAGNLAVESLAQFAPGLPLAAGLGAVGGAVGGSVVPGPGTAVGGALGLATGVGGTSFLIEYGHKIFDSMSEAGVDLTDPAQITAGFADEALMEEARDRAVKKGVPIAIFDAISGGIAGRLLLAAPKTVIGKALGGAGELAIQSGLGAGGEAAGQYREKGEVYSAPEVLAEAIAELGPGAGQVAIGAYQARGGKTPPDAGPPPSVEGEPVPPPPEGFVPDTGISTEAPPVVDEEGEETIPPPPPGFVMDEPEPAPEPVAEPVQPQEPPEAPEPAPEAEIAPVEPAVAPEEIAAAAAEVEPEPTEAQKEAGNYKKGHVSAQGLDITIETPKGATRSGTDADGKPWSVEMPAHYGYIKRSEGADGEQVDVYLGDYADRVEAAPDVYVVDQKDLKTGEFDEHKVLLGFQNEAAARRAYIRGFSDNLGNERIAGITPYDMEAFKAALAKGEFKKGGVVEPKKPRIRGKRPIRHKPLTLAEFIAAEGGMRDETGELKAMDAHLWHRGKPFRGRLVRDDGIPPEDMRLKAQEARYIAEGTITGDLYELLRQDLSETEENVYSDFDTEAVAAMREAQATERDREESRFRMEQEADRLGIPGETVETLDDDGLSVAIAEGQLQQAAPEEVGQVRDVTEDDVDRITREALADEELTDAEREDIEDVPFPEVGAQPAPAEDAGPSGEPARPEPRETEDAGAREESTEDRGEDGAEGAEREPTTELTEQGEQTIIPGAEKISDKEFVERQSEGPKKAPAPQKGPPEGGLFDEDARKQLDLVDKVKAAEREEAKAKPQKPPGKEDERHALAGTAPLTEGYRDNQKRVVSRLRQIAKDIAPRARLRVVDELWGDIGSRRRKVRGSHKAAENLISVALNYADPENALKHEAVHALKSMGLFTTAEWAALEKQAKHWRKTYRIDQLYSNLSAADRNEEAIAAAFAEFRSGKQFPPGFRRIFDRVRLFLRRIANTLRGFGFTTPEDIFERVERGEVGRRPGRQTAEQAVRYAVEDRLTPEQLAALEDIGRKIGAPKRGLRQRLTDIVSDRLSDRMKAGIADDLHGLKLLELAANDGKLYEDARSAYKLARLSRGINDLIFDAMMLGAPIWSEGTTSIDTDVKSPMQIIEALGDRVLHFEKYMAMRRAQELNEQGRENLFTEDNIAAGLALAEVYEDFPGLFDDMQTYNKRLLDFVEQSGLLSPETRAFFEEMHQNYVPFYRIMENEKGVKGPAARMGFAGQHPNFIKLKGGEQNIEHPFLNWERNIHRLIEASAKNVVMLRTEQLNAEIGGLFMTARGKMPRKVAVNNKQMIDDLTAQGLEITPEDGVAPDALRILWSLGNAPKGDNIVSWVRGGKVRYGEVHDVMLFRALTMLHRTAGSVFLKPFKMAKHLLTAAVGLDPSFQVANFWRDTIHASVVSHIGFQPVKDSVEGFGRLLNSNDPYVREFFRSGAGMSSLFEADRPTLHRVVEKKLNPKGKLGTILDTPRGFLGALERLESTFEYATRIGAFKRLRAQGKPLIEAAYQAREISTDFAMRGSWAPIRFLAETVPFFNAGLQGLYRTGRGAHENPVAFAIKGGLITSASLALYFMFRDDERFKELPEYQRDMYLNFWIGDQHYKFPQPFEVGAIFSSIPQRLAELAIEQNGERFAERMGWIVTEMFRLDVVPQLIRPPLRIYSNRDEFRDRPVVPPWLDQSVRPEEKYTSRTSQVAIETGRALGVAPAHLETLVQGYLGAWGGYLMAASDTMLRGLSDKYPDPPSTRLYDLPVIRRFVGPKVPRSTRYLDELYEMREEVNRTYSSIQRLLTLGEVDRAKTLMRESPKKLALRDSLNKMAQQQRKLNRVMRMIRSNKFLSGEEKTERLDRLLEARSRLARVVERLEPIYREK